MEIWSTIQELFEDHGHARRAHLLRNVFINGGLEHCDSMQTYLANCLSTFSKLENVGLNVDDGWQISLLLAGLPSSYDPFVIAIKANKNLTADQLKSLLMETSEGIASTGEAFFSKNKTSKKKNFKKKQKKCYICNSTEHLSNVCTQKTKEGATKKNNGNANSAFCAFILIIKHYCE